MIRIWSLGLHILNENCFCSFVLIYGNSASTRKSYEQCLDTCTGLQRKLLSLLRILTNQGAWWRILHRVTRTIDGALVVQKLGVLRSEIEIKWVVNFLKDDDFIERQLSDSIFQCVKLRSSNLKAKVTMNFNCHCQSQVIVIRFWMVWWLEIQNYWSSNMVLLCQRQPTHGSRRLRSRRCRV